MSDPGEPADVCAYYYDTDFPTEAVGEIRDELEKLGIARDVERILAIAHERGGPVLEIGAGTGRVTLPLARAGLAVTAVDTNEAMLSQLREKLGRESAEVARRVTILQADASSLDAPRARYKLALIPFSTLPCIADFSRQCLTFERVAAHVERGAALIVDTINPLTMIAAGDVLPRATLTRINHATGNRYQRFTVAGPLDGEQRQAIRGWYEEHTDEGRVIRRAYETLFRPVFRYELELMVDRAGFAVRSVEGDHDGGPFVAASRVIFLRAERR